MPSSKPTISVEAATATAEMALDGKFNNHPTTIEYLARADGSVALTRVIQIRNEDAGTWVEAFIDAHSGQLLSITDFVTKASVGTPRFFLS
jgi:extracellular elastinolytic metalloproteinase